MRSLHRFREYALPYRNTLAAGVGLAVVEILLNLAQPWPLAFLVDHVLRPDEPSMSPRAGIAIAVGALLALVVAGAVADYWSTWFMSGAGECIGVDLRQRVFAHLQRMSLRYHGQHSVGDLSTRVMGDVDRVQDLIIQILSVLIPNALLMVGMIVVMMSVDAVFALIALACTPVLVLLTWRSTRSMKAASRAARKFDGQVASTTTESLAAVQVVQALSLEDAFEARFGDVSEASLRASLKAVHHQARFGPIVDVSSAISMAIVMGIGALRVLDGEMSLGVLLVFTTYIGSLYKPIKALAKLGTAVGKGAASTERLESILATDPEIGDRPNARPAPRLRGQIEFDGVSFAYGDQPVLHDIRCSIDTGCTTALVGPTGAGKSTLVGLLPRLFDPTAGAVRIDGIDIRDLTLASLRRQIAMVLQETVLFRGTLAENIVCGWPDATDEAVARAARLALVDEFADQLPDGLDTMVGERGATLSGGQRQRVAIARALLRDAPILILDEPTSALDAESEALVVRALEHLTAGRTTLVIAHRLSTVRRADKILVIEHGRITETGTHDELRLAGGSYARMVSLQGGVVGPAVPPTGPADSPTIESTPWTR